MLFSDIKTFLLETAGKTSSENQVKSSRRFFRLCLTFPDLQRQHSSEEMVSSNLG